MTHDVVSKRDLNVCCILTETLLRCAVNTYIIPLLSAHLTLITLISYFSRSFNSRYTTLIKLYSSMTIVQSVLKEKKTFFYILFGTPLLLYTYES